MKTTNFLLMALMISLIGCNKDEVNIPEADIESVVMSDGRTWTAVNLDTVPLGFKDQTWWYINSHGGVNKDFGRLYTWDAAKEACRSLGGKWRLPSNEEWFALAESCGEWSFYEYTIHGNSGRIYYNNRAYKYLVSPLDDEYALINQFNARLAGSRSGIGRMATSKLGAYWTGSSYEKPSLVWTYVFRGYDKQLQQWNSYKDEGLSCRCIKAIAD